MGLRISPSVPHYGGRLPSGQFLSLAVLIFIAHAFVRALFVCGPLGISSIYWDSVPRVLNPPTPFSRERSGPTDFPSPQWLPCPPTPARHLMTCLNPPNPLFKGAHQASVRTRAHGHRFAVLRPASDDALLHLWTVLFRLPGPEVYVRVSAVTGASCCCTCPFEALFRTGLVALFRGCPKHCRDIAVNSLNNLHVDILWILLIVN